MFNALVSQSLRNRLIVLAVAAVLILYGAFTATKLPLSRSSAELNAHMYAQQA